MSMDAPTGRVAQLSRFIAEQSDYFAKCIEFEERNAQLEDELAKLRAQYNHALRLLAQHSIPLDQKPHTE